MSEQMRTFESGATRNADDSKLDFEGFLSPLVLERFGEYMHKHRKQADGKLRDSDNWQKGIPLDAYIKSGYRHFFDWWKEHRGISTQEGIEDSLCALLFNVQGYLHERLRSRCAVDPDVINGPWVPWSGHGEIPFDHPVMIDVKYRSGATIVRVVHPKRWRHFGDQVDIIAYRVVKEGE